MWLLWVNAEAGSSFICLGQLGCHEEMVHCKDNVRVHQGPCFGLPSAILSQLRL